MTELLALAAVLIALWLTWLAFRPPVVVVSERIGEYVVTITLDAREFKRAMVDVERLLRETSSTIAEYAETAREVDA